MYFWRTKVISATWHFLLRHEKRKLQLMKYLNCWSVGQRICLHNCDAASKYTRTIESSVKNCRFNANIKRQKIHSLLGERLTVSQNLLFGRVITLSVIRCNVPDTQLWHSATFRSEFSAKISGTSRRALYDIEWPLATLFSSYSFLFQ